MITHEIPFAEAASKPASGDAWAGSAFVPRRRLPALALRAPDQSAGALQGGHGPFCVPLHLAARCQGPGLDSGTLSRGARARWVRGPLLLSAARPAAARCRRQSVTQGDLGAERALAALCGGARAV